MGLLGALVFSTVLVTLMQICPSSAQSCRILSTSSPSSSSILVNWAAYPTASAYILDIRKRNSTDSAPIILLVPSQSTEKTVQGLVPGAEYNVTIKVIRFYNVECVNSTLARTVPDTPQILEGRSYSSSSISVKWSMVPSAQYYILLVHSQSTGSSLNFTLYSTSTVVQNLLPSSNYDCYVSSVNQAGVGDKSKVRTITTLVPPPTGVTALQTDITTARVMWQPVSNVLMYQVVVQNLDEPTMPPSAYNVTNTRLDVGNIQPCTSYLISVSSFNKFLIPSEPTNYTHTTNKLEPVSSVSADYSCTSHAAVVSWSAVAGAKSYVATATSPNGTMLECTSQQTSCTIVGLSCGQLYEVHVTPKSGSCKNLVNATSAFFQTESCAPGNLTLVRHCWSNVIIFSWNPVGGADHYLARAVDSKGIVQHCLTEDNFCHFTNTECGRQYVFTVVSILGSCQSDRSSSVDVRTAPCMPENLRALANCSTDVLLSTWDNAEGALRYTVTAEGNFKNSSYSCNSQSNSCAMEGVHCGESLTITITAFDDECASPPTLGLPAETVPCTPENVSAVKDCGSDSLTVNWAINGGSLFYIATARDDNGTVHTCNSIDMSCQISRLRCSTSYSVSVMSSNFMCNSSESDVVTVETASCPPTNLTTSLNCSANEALVSWQADPTLNSFTVTMVDQEDGLLSCSSTKSKCVVPNLKCGQLYSVTARYHDGICPGLPSEPLYMDSVPCGPRDLRADLQCVSGVTNMSWSPQRNAEGYIAVITDSNMQKVQHNISGPQLIVGPKDCGQEYSVKVMSYNQSCVSFPSTITFKEVPCVPTTVNATKGCGQNFVGLTWPASRGAKTYTATAVDEHGARLQCASNTTSCMLTGAACGHIYNISVASVDDTCTSMKSPEVRLLSEPCPPTDLTVSVNCTGNSTSLSWNASTNAVSYTGKAVSADGHAVSCEVGNMLGCELKGLHCGTKYVFTVSASDGSCQSADSRPVTRFTAPCPVQNVSNTLDCGINTLRVSWAPASMPVNYSATAWTPNGTALRCTTENSSCVLGTLQCGLQYTVKVKAISSLCEGYTSVPTTVNAVPCVPQNIQSGVECSTNTLRASWSASAGATSYISTVTSPGANSSSCSSDTLSCQFPNLKCAQTYTMSVVARNDRCNSSRSATVSAITAPCDPANVTASLNCSSDVATVTWSPSAGAQYYTVVADAGGLTDSCNSTGTSCKLFHLQCGKDYTVTVLAGDSKCNSSMLAKTNLTTAPCAPVIQDPSRYCITNRTLVTWAKDKYAVSVTVSASSNLRHSVSCSSSTNSSCYLDQLLCGHTYTVQAVAYGVQCSSKPSAKFEIVMAPCTPANVVSQFFCDTGIAFVSWDETLGRDSFYVKARSEDHTASCSTSGGTDCYLVSLLCSHTYNVEVVAVAGNCNSSVPGVTQIQTAPCPPTNVSASLLCGNNTAQVRWQHSPGAISYHVVAAGRDGDRKECTTNTSSCQIPNMHCAQVYIVTVTPSSSKCQGLDSRPYSYLAGPCPPTNVQASLQCDGNVGHVTWDAALQADQYVVSTVPSVVDSHIHNCSTNGTSCSLTGLHCGETVAITVVTRERGCQSDPSTPLLFKTVICPPATVTAVTTCSSNDITVSWDRSPESGVEYLIHAQNGNGTLTKYNTSQVYYTMTGLHCGDLYTFAVAGKNSACTSVLSKKTQTETVPCAPANLTVKTECGTNMATLKWAPSSYAISYTATFTSSLGHSVSCTTNTTTCSVKVDCGKPYTAVLVATTAACNSTSATLLFDSAPCLPDQVQAELNCSTNSFAVQWRGSAGYVGTYTAIAIGSDESRVQCNTADTKCTILNLKCGVLYSIVVTTPSIDCGTIEGSDYQIYSAPCEPNSIAVDLECSTHVALVTWENAGPDQTQVVTATDRRGLTTTCNSSSSNCTFPQLECGKVYDITVVGHTNSCSSDSGITQELRTAPCTPTHLRATLDCDTGITMVTWDSALGATLYSVHARGSLGHAAECNTSNTYCDFLNLECGQNYTMTVVALHDSCVSIVSEPITMTTGPCPHKDLRAALDCSTNSVEVSWTPGRGILYYNVSANPFNSLQERACATNGSSCNISSLQCGDTYSVMVTGQGEKCPILAQDWQKVKTAPCPPTELSVDSSCETNDITVSWVASAGSDTYMAVAESEPGRQWSCNTSATTCQISELACGQTYQVYVVGIDQNCFGAKSDVKVIHTAPCVPENVQNHLDCESGVLNITWESTGHYSLFHTSVANSNGHSAGCSTDKHYCVVRNMHCEATYDVTVVAKDEFCNSSSTPVKKVVTAPCPLSSYTPVINCATGVASIMWNTSVPGVVHTVTAEDATGQKHNCTGTDTGCELSSLECGTEYNVTITPSRSECVGQGSPTQTITTVPCVPELSEAEIDCLANSAWVTFEPSLGAEIYILRASNPYGAILTFECNATTDGTCPLPPLPCSQNLTFTVMAQDQQCTSAASNAITTETAPCPPENVMEFVNCDNGTMTVSWSDVPGAVMYTATLEEINGGKPGCCSTSGNSCDITGLPCGEMYILHVTAEGRTCNSTESEGLITRTVPCVPENLDGRVSCSSNVASMSWGFSRGGQLYTVKAVGTDGHEDQCRSPDNQCELTHLQCGQYYTATVVAEDIECRSKPSENVTIKTVPCTPESISSVMDCDANSLIVSWSESSGADSYIATFRDIDGQTTTCLGTTEGSCNVTGLGCSQIYRVSVVSSDGYCDSTPTYVVETPSIPCQPRNIRATMDCYTKTAEVSWYPSDGVITYEVFATTKSGSSASCETNVTSCELEELECGVSYSVSVRAVGETCSSVADMIGVLETEPCIPEYLTTLYGLTIGQVQWDLAGGAYNYTVIGQTDQGLVVTCTTTQTDCTLYNMQCGQVYNITVAAHNHVCDDVSVSTEAAAIVTEPCPPNNVQANVDCQTDQGTVSWEASVGAVGYEAQLAGRDGHSLTCQTNGTFCNVEDVHCGVVYYTKVIAIGETLNSSASTPVLLVAAPCTATDVAASLDCDNSSAEISWTSGVGASSYKAAAASADGFVAFCETEELQCELTGLQCGQTYNVTLTTISEHCQIEEQIDVAFSTRPCEPMRLQANMECGSRAASLLWEDGEGVEMYLATATSSTGEIMTCNSTEASCVFNDLECGETYDFSVTAFNDMCSSETSSSVEIQTEPCQPTGLAVAGSCNDETVVFAWSEAEGALTYEVTATGHLGYVASFKTNETTLEADLPCGQTFTVTVKAQDDSACDSVVSTPATYKSGPCIPQHLHSFTHCEDSLGSVGWVTGAKAESYLAIAVGQDGHTHECTSNTTTCTWTDLHCGELYTVSVIALDYNCASMPGNTTTIKMAPCIPQNVTSSFNCAARVGSLTWNASEAADYYIATAETNSGHKVQLSTNETWTFISEFLCGQEYFLSVQAADSECTSGASPPTILISEPCPPTAIVSEMNCVSNIAVVSWTTSAGSEFYTATVTPEDGQSKSCWSDIEQCSMPNVPCGQNYTVTVVASNGTCDSDPSEADILQSVPCVPSNVEVVVDCSENHAVVSWSASDGALSYKVLAESTQGARSLCETTDLTCTLTDLICGQQYGVQVVSEDDICSSLPSPLKQFPSVPCTPAMGSVVLDCYTDSALLDWRYADGALRYTATARSASGHVTTCNSNETNCELPDLQCGQIYDAVAVASNDQCSSPPSDVLQVESVPCPPENVVSTVDCATNSAQVEWQASAGARSYVVQAFGVEEHETGCETESQYCMLVDLMCGFTYNITVIAVNDVCNATESEVTQLQTAPCVPEQVQARVDCEFGGVTVSWEPSKGASSYTSVANGGAGYASTCNSTETYCWFDDLLCGLNYSISVTASDDSCSSGESAAVDIATVPCVPQNVAAEMECSNNTGVVSWEEGEGVTSYRVRAFGPDGHKPECDSIESSCELLSMHCGQLYNLTITAQDGLCDNSNAYLTLMSVPCRPTNVKAALLHHSNTAAVTWERASGAITYTAVGVTADGAHMSECNNTETYCDLEDLLCGQTYSVSVLAQDEACSSVESDITHVRSAPCPPQNVVIDAQCAKGAMVVSWSPNPDAQYFHAVVVSNTGARLYCNSSEPSCTFSHLPCGQHYNVTVLAVRDTYESEPSAMVESCSAPCVPENPKGNLDCVSNAAWVEWDHSQGASSYYVYAEAAGGLNSSCSSASSPCSVPDLQCGTLYTFHVTALNRHCNSSNSTSFQIETGPCALTSVSAVTECNNDTIYVKWERTPGTPVYVVTAEAEDHTMLSCNTSSNFCVLRDVRCGTHYSVIVSTSSDKCSSLRSPPQKIKTTPCVPSNVTMAPVCEKNGAVISWAKSAVATSYDLTATGQDGHIVSCNTSVSNCTLGALHCGQMYNVHITAIGDQCRGPASLSTFKSVPCPLSDVAVNMDCHTKSGTLSWSNSNDVVEYFSQAVSLSGQSLHCNSSRSSCTFEGLECGDIYNFTVKASDGSCNSTPSAPLEAGAVPCPPSHLRIRMQRIKQSDWAMISWDKVNCSGVEYLAEINGRIGDNPQALMKVASYWLRRPYYELPVPCSTAFNVTVRSRNAAGVGDPSSVYTGLTAPCAPQMVEYSGDTLSWEASVFATSYIVYNVSEGDRVTLCSTTELSCQIPDFYPDSTEVVAVNQVGESIPSQSITGGGGTLGARRRRALFASISDSEDELPVPEILALTGNRESLNVKWREVEGATEYVVSVKKEQSAGQASPPNVRTVEGHFFRITDLTPLTTYCVRVAAKNGVHQSSFSTPKCRNTGASS